MKTSNTQAFRCLLRALCVVALMTAVSCGGLKVVPVGGKVTVDGQPLTRGFITFNPDPAKGNNARVACTSRIGGDGQYALYTDDGSHVKKGAPVGWYKVTISNTPGDEKPLPVNSKYADFAKTDLEVEVTPNAAEGDYDLKFTK